MKSECHAIYAATSGTLNPCTYHTVRNVVLASRAEFPKISRMHPHRLFVEGLRSWLLSRGFSSVGQSSLQSLHAFWKDPAPPTNKPPDGLLCFHWYISRSLESTLVTRCLRNTEKPLTHLVNVMVLAPFWKWGAGEPSLSPANQFPSAEISVPRSAGDELNVAPTGGYWNRLLQGKCRRSCQPAD
jgi:hypothetical protein